MTLDHARALLRDSATVLDASHELGLSGPGRLHDLFVTHEAMTPGAWQTGGAGLAIGYGFHPSPFGTRAGDVATARPCRSSPSPIRAGRRRAHRHEGALAERGGTPRTASAPLAYAGASSTRRVAADQPLRVVMIGTDFEVQVWETLLRIPCGKAATYSDIASHIGKPPPRARSGRRLARTRSPSSCPATG